MRDDLLNIQIAHAAMVTQPIPRPILLRKRDGESDRAELLIVHAPSGLATMPTRNGVATTRAALRSALGYPVLPLWGGQAAA
jgi:hypothetical protein